MVVRGTNIEEKMLSKVEVKLSLLFGLGSDYWKMFYTLIQKCYIVRAMKPQRYRKDFNGRKMEIFRQFMCHLEAKLYK